MDILMHPAARWGPDDFDLPTQPPMQTTLETAPHYLQPTHEPQIRLPSFSSWFSGSQNDQSATLPTFDGYNGSGREQSFVSSPASAVQPPFQISNSATHLWPGTYADAAYTGPYHHDCMAPPVQTAFRNPWEDSVYTDNWINDGIDFAADNTNFDGHFEAQQPPTLPFHDCHEASLSQPHHIETYTMPALPQQEPTHAITAPQYKPSPTHRNPVHAVKLKEQPEGFHAPPTPSSQSPPSASRTEDVGEIADAEEASMVDHSQSLGLPYVHNLCGKAFSTLTGVRKHHWGKKARDLDTTTGCWAKHNKPNVSWDDHSSCQIGRSTSAVAKTLPTTTKQKPTKSSLSQSTTPSMVDVPHFQPLQGVRTLEDLPHIVSNAVNASLATDASTQDPPMLNQTPLIASRRKFDTLLTAVNVVSQIDAPKPKGRAESIALNLDAQVAAAERHQFSMPYKTSTSSLNLQQYPAIAPAALVMAGDSSTREFSKDVGGHRVNFFNEGRTSLVPSGLDATDPGAISRTFQPLVASPSGPAWKKRKV